MLGAAQTVLHMSKDVCRIQEGSTYDSASESMVMRLLASSPKLLWLRLTTVGLRDADVAGCSLVGRPLFSSSSKACCSTEPAASCLFFCLFLWPGIRFASLTRLDPSSKLDCLLLSIEESIEFRTPVPLPSLLSSVAVTETLEALLLWSRRDFERMLFKRLPVLIVADGLGETSAASLSIAADRL